MDKTHVTLSVFHDGQFFTALFERSDESGYSVSRFVFAAKPCDNEILGLVLKGYGALNFTSPSKDDAVKPLAANPKRRQREAAKAAVIPAMSTKAQLALKAQHEQSKAACKAAGKQRREDAEAKKFEIRQLKRKQKHKGR